jgi:hypothetical protein
MKALRASSSLAWVAPPALRRVSHCLRQGTAFLGASHSKVLCGHPTPRTLNSAFAAASNFALIVQPSPRSSNFPFAAFLNRDALNFLAISRLVAQ